MCSRKNSLAVVQTHAMRVCLLLSLMSGCNDTKLNSGRPDAAQPAHTPAPIAEPVSKYEPSTTPNTTVPPVIANLDTNAVATSNQPVVPDGIVDGMEVINDCSRCLQRAQQLSTSAGFAAIVPNTINMGFYKIDPSQNLCDIHFLANQRIEVSDHEGRDSILDNQVALYCPCNCGWARGTPVDPYF